MARSWRAAALVALIAAAATFPARAQVSLATADAVLQSSTSSLLANPLAALNRGNGQAAAQEALLRAARALVLRAQARSNRVLVDAGAGDQEEMSASDLCLTSLPCFADIMAAAGNTTVQAITSAASCPISSAQAANCYYTLATSCTGLDATSSSTEESANNEEGNVDEEAGCAPASPPPPPSPPPPAPNSVPVCLALMLSPTPASQTCVMKASLALPSFVDSVLGLPKATSNCSKANFVSTFPCYQNIMRSMAYIASALEFKTTPPACPNAAYLCNCYATIAQTCPDAEMMTASPPSPPSPPPCPSTESDGSGLEFAAQCPALALLVMTGSFAKSCPANVGGTASAPTPIVLTSSAATTPPPLTPPVLDATCAAALNMPVAAAPVKLVAASVTLSGYTVDEFRGGVQTAFVAGTAKALGVAPADVTITSVTASTAAGRRRLMAGGITVAFTVAAPSAAAASTLSSSVSALTANGGAAYAAQLTAAGLSKVTAAGITVAAAPTVTAGPASAGVAARAGAALLLVAAAAVAL